MSGGETLLKNIGNNLHFLPPFPITPQAPQAAARRAAAPAAPLGKVIPCGEGELERNALPKRSFATHFWGSGGMNAIAAFYPVAGRLWGWCCGVCPAVVGGPAGAPWLYRGMGWVEGGKQMEFLLAAWGVWVCRLGGCSGATQHPGGLA